MAVPYSIQSVPLSKIDFKESQHNGARLDDALVEHKIEDYMQAFRNGDAFPRPVMHKTATGYVILSGNQRCESVRRLANEGDLPKTLNLEAYVVDTQDKLLLEIIARIGNVSHGEGITKTHRLVHAVDMVERCGLSSSDAAKYWTVSTQAINEHIKANKVRRTLQKSGVEAHRLPLTTLSPLAKLDFDEGAQVKLGTLATQHNPPAERVRQVVASLTKQTTAAGRVNRIKEFEKELAEEAHSKQKPHSNGNGHAPSKVPLRPRRDKFFGLATRLCVFLENDNNGEAFRTLDELQIVTGKDEEQAIELLKKLRYRVGALLK